MSLPMVVLNGAATSTPEGAQLPRNVLSAAQEPAPRMLQVRGEMSRAAIKALDHLDEALKMRDPKLISACAIAVGILCDKAILADVRVERHKEPDYQDLDAARARQQAIDDEIARRKAALLRKGATDTVEITPQLLEELDKPQPEPEG